MLTTIESGSNFSTLYSLTPRTPRSTLFPYTTLFRSARCCARPRCRRPARRRCCAASSSTARGRSTSTTDRKSTRLNSSHGYISYAVFCLKKKNNVFTHSLEQELAVNRDIIRVSYHDH